MKPMSEMFVKEQSRQVQHSPTADAIFAVEYRMWDITCIHFTQRGSMTFMVRNESNIIKDARERIKLYPTWCYLHLGLSLKHLPSRCKSDLVEYSLYLPHASFLAVISERCFYRCHIVHLAGLPLLTILYHHLAKPCICTFYQVIPYFVYSDLIPFMAPKTACTLYSRYVGIVELQHLQHSFWPDLMYTCPGHQIIYTVLALFQRSVP